MRQAHSKLVDRLTELNPDALLLEPRDQFDQALVAITNAPDDLWDRSGDNYVAVYNEELCIETIMKLAGCDEERAAEFFHFNTAGAYLGPDTPTFTSSHPDE